MQVNLKAMDTKQPIQLRACLEIQDWRRNGVPCNDPNAQFLELDHPSSKVLK